MLQESNWVNNPRYSRRYPARPNHLQTPLRAPAQEAGTSFSSVCAHRLVGPRESQTTSLMEPIGALPGEVGDANSLKDMVGPCGLEPQTSTVSTSRPNVRSAPARRHKLLSGATVAGGGRKRRNYRFTLAPETPARRSCHRDRSDHVHPVPKRLSVRAW